MKFHPFVMDEAKLSGKVFSAGQNNKDGMIISDASLRWQAGRPKKLQEMKSSLLLKPLRRLATQLTLNSQGESCGGSLVWVNL